MRRDAIKEAEAGLRRCLLLDASDPRTYVVLGKLLLQQKRYDEARELYTMGSTVTGALLGLDCTSCSCRVYW